MRCLCGREPFFAAAARRVGTCTVDVEHAKLGLEQGVSVVVFSSLSCCRSCC